MIGAGVFTSSGFALGALGSPDRVVLAWVLGGVIALLGALSYGALAERLTESGGEYLFLSRTLHPLAGFLAGWASLWAGFTSAIALAAEATQAYLAPWIPAAVPPDLVGAAAIVALGLLHTRGLQHGARAQTALVAVKVLGLLAFLGLGALRLPAVPPASPGPFEVGPFAVTLMWISLSYSGWNAAVYIAGEARAPSRTVPRAMVVGTLATALLYVGLNAVFVHAAPFDALANQQDVAAVAARALGGAWLEGAMRVVVVVALLTSISSMVMIGPRVYAQMAEDGLFPRRFAFVGAAPRQAIGLQVALSLVVLFVTDLRAQLTNVGWLLGLFTALSVVGLLRLRRREGAERVPIPGYPFVPVAFVLSVVTLAGLALQAAGPALAPAVSVLGSGLLAFRAAARPRGTGPGSADVP